MQPAFAPQTPQPTQGGRPSPQEAPEVSQALEHLRSQGIVPAFGSSASTSQVPPEPSGDGRVPVLGDILKPFAEAGLSFIAPYRAVSGGLTGGLEGARKAVEPIDLPIVGKTSPMGSVTPQEALTGPGINKFVRETAGNALQMAPYFLPFSQLPASAPLLSRMATGAGQGAVSGALGGGGRAIREGEGAKGIAVSTAQGALGGAIVGGATPAVTTGVRKASSLWTGVDDADYTSVLGNPDKLAYGQQVRAENPKDAYSALAQRIGDKLNSDRKEAAASWKSAMEQFSSQNPDARFDVSSRAREITDALSEFGIKAKVVKGNVVLYQDGPASVGKAGMGKLQEFANELYKARNLDADQLIRLRQTFNRIYNEIPKGEFRDVTPAHAAMMKMKGPLDKVLSETLPPQLRAADAAIASWYDTMEDFGYKIIDGKGRMDKNAGAFLRSLNRGEKLEWQSAVGPELMDRLDAIRLADQFANIKPNTGSRPFDIIKAYAPSVISGGAGAVALGASPAAALPILGTVLGMSPLVAGKVLQAVSAGSQNGFNQAVKTGLAQMAGPPVGEGLLSRARRAVLGE